MGLGWPYWSSSSSRWCSWRSCWLTSQSWIGEWGSELYHVRCHAFYAVIWHPNGPVMFSRVPSSAHSSPAVIVLSDRVQSGLGMRLYVMTVYSEFQLRSNIACFVALLLLTYHYYTLTYSAESRKQLRNRKYSTVSEMGICLCYFTLMHSGYSLSW